MKRTYLVLIITMLVVGFAAVATNLAINGTINFGFNNSDFNSNVIFTYAKAKNGEATITGDDKKTITFETIKLENVNQEAILKYDIANKSSQYDASVTMNCIFEKDSESYEEYLDIDNSLDSKFILKSGETITGHLTVTLIKAYNASLTQDVNMLCTIEATPGERDTEGTYVPVDHDYEEILLKGADPVLEATPVEGIALTSTTSEKNLIPVKIDEEGHVTRADTTKEWYNYEEQKWANAVILKDGVEDPGIENEIPEENIESYFVWIPKYRYKIFNVEKYSSANATTDSYEEKSQIIEIEFGVDNTKDSETECVTPKSGEDGNCTVGKWMTHPAFTSFGDIKGFWVGKFETGYNQNNETTNVTLNSTWTKEGAQIDEINESKIIIKPNVYSWRKIEVVNAFKNSYNYQRKLDSHMMKNTEWGAVAYLSHSKYGTCSDNVCTEIRINNSVSQLTGVAAKNEPNTGYDAYNDYEKNTPSVDGTKTYNYTNPASQVASTTGNYTGIYDMSGGAWEYMMSVMKASTNENVFALDNSGFDSNSFPFDNQDENSKYYDVYAYNSDKTSYQNRILGDATGEMGPFYGVRYNTRDRDIGSWKKQEGFFIYSNTNWFLRSGSYGTGTGAGIFSFGRNSDNGQDYNSFRIVLSPQ